MTTASAPTETEPAPQTGAEGVTVSQNEDGKSVHASSFFGHTTNPVGDSSSSGSSARNFDKGGGGSFNILKDYKWTNSRVQARSDLPYVSLKEHRNTESSIMRMLKFYGGGMARSAQDVGSQIAGIIPGGSEAVRSAANSLGVNNASTGVLNVYDEIFPENPTGNNYTFPFFTKSYYELSTPMWNQLDSVGDVLGGVAQGASDIVGKFDNLKGFSKHLDLANAAAGAVGAATKVALSMQYPVVGTQDRPRIFATHDPKGINIEFPLFNTLHADDWLQNYKFLTIFMSQNLFNKRDYITGYPPCYYRVYVPGQYFSFASCVTNFSVENLGNIRIMEAGGKQINVPDAYQVKITLNEMVMPSLNQFQALLTNDAQQRVTVG
jgi:hypothetical protein